MPSYPRFIRPWASRVLLASQVQPEAEPPFIVYSVTADYIPDGGLGNYSLGEGATQDDLVEVREEQPTATLSFTAWQREPLLRR